MAKFEVKIEKEFTEQDSENIRIQTGETAFDIETVAKYYARQLCGSNAIICQFKYIKDNNEKIVGARGVVLGNEFSVKKI